MKDIHMTREAPCFTVSVNLSVEPALSQVLSKSAIDRSIKENLAKRKAVMNAKRKAQNKHNKLMKKIRSRSNRA